MKTMREMAHEATQRSRRAQGLPPQIRDPEVLARVATLVATDGLNISRPGRIPEQLPNIRAARGTPLGADRT